jgi:3-methyl-2-oxobutanoate hydroxymethyltransferase
MPALTRKTTLADMHAARQSGAKLPVLTCYDYTTARLMERAGVPVLLVGDSAANVILGHSTTLPISLGFLCELAAAVRRGAPLAYVIADMPFGSYAGSLGRAVRNVCSMARRSGCDAVKLEVTEGHRQVIRASADAGVAVMAHLGLRPQSVSVLGGYKVQGRTAVEASRIVDLAGECVDAGAVAILLEAVPGEVGEAVVQAVKVPVIGCGAGSACHGHVVVTHDAVGLTDHTPRFVPRVGDLAAPTVDLLARYARLVTDGEYPAAEHGYSMAAGEAERLAALQGRPAAHAT